jgi:hypothetical protein
MRPGQPTVAIDLLSALLLVVGVGIFVAGNAFREERIPAITAIGIPLSGLLPALFTVGNLVLAGVLLDDTAVPIVVVAAILLIALGADAVFVVYCRALLESFTATRLTSLRSPLARVAGLGVYATIILPAIITWRFSTPRGVEIFHEVIAGSINLVLLATLGIAVLALSTWAVPRLIPTVRLPVLGITPLSGHLRAVFTPLPGPGWAYATGLLQTASEQRRWSGHSGDWRTCALVPTRPDRSRGSQANHEPLAAPVASGPPSSPRTSCSSGACCSSARIGPSTSASSTCSLGLSSRCRPKRPPPDT